MINVLTRQRESISNVSSSFGFLTSIRPEDNFQQKYKDENPLEVINEAHKAWKNLEKLFDNATDLDRINHARLEVEASMTKVRRMLKWAYERQLITKNQEEWDMLWHNSLSNNTDITNRKKLEEKLRRLAYYDNLTKLPNRKFIEDEVKALRGQDLSFTVVYMDVDNFKYINDTLGHAIGDQFLKYIANKLKQVVQSPDVIARISEDEYVILFKEINSKEELEKKLKDIDDALGRIWKTKDHEFFISFSIGIALYPKDGLDYDTLLRNADIAMYKAKRSGKGRHVFFTKEILADNVQGVQMTSQLRNALENDELHLYYQPQFNLSSGQIIGVEALIRWIHPEKGFISPGEFIPLSEETGQIYDIEKWVLKTALLQKKEFEEKGFSNIDVSINLSSKSLTNDANFNELEKILESFDIDYSHITIEITETAAIYDVEVANERIKKLKSWGLKIALDDFGTGYSSLTHLKKLPIDIVKLDRSFVKRIEDNSKDAIIIKALLCLAHDLNYSIIAEGIETEGQLEYLRKYNCDYGQGYLMGRPVDIKSIQEKLKSDYRLNRYNIKTIE